jgi:hypothetical protein
MNKEMKNTKITPVTRINKFFSSEDFELEISMGREALEGDGNFTAILYKVDRDMTESDSVYNEGTKDGIRFFPPIEIKIIPILGEPENKSYTPTNGSARYLQDGPFTFSIYSAQLEELETDIDFGDYIGYAVNETDIRYYSVSNDGKKNFDNKHTIMGYKGAFRTILCAPVDASEFRGV